MQLAEKIISRHTYLQRPIITASRLSEKCGVQGRVRSLTLFIRHGCHVRNLCIALEIPKEYGLYGGTREKTQPLLLDFKRVTLRHCSISDSALRKAVDRCEVRKALDTAAQSVCDA